MNEGGKNNIRAGRNMGQALVLAGIVITSLNLRAAVTSLSAIFSEVSRDIPGFEISLMGILPLLCFAVFGACAPVIKNRLGFEKALFVSMLMVGAGLLLRALTSGFSIFLLCSVIALAGMAFGNVLLPPMFKKYFPGNTGAITAVYAIVIAVSAGVPSVLSASTVETWGWRIDIGLWAAVGFAAAIPWLLQMLLRPELVRAEPSGAIKRSLRAYRWPQAWAMALLFGVGGMLPMYTVINWLPTYLQDNGMSMPAAGTALFLYNVLGILHSFAVPLVIGKMKNPFLLVILAFVLQIAGYLGFVLHVKGALIWCVITAPGLLTVPATFQLFNLRSRTPEGATQLSAFVQFIGYLFAAAGPITFGWLKKLSGGFMLPFAFLALMSVITLFAGYFAMRDNYLEDA